MASKRSDIQKEKALSEPITLASFDPTNFLVVPERRFEDLKVGDIFRAPSRTLTDAHAAASDGFRRQPSRALRCHLGCSPRAQRSCCAWAPSARIYGPWSHDVSSLHRGGLHRVY